MAAVDTIRQRDIAVGDHSLRLYESGDPQAVPTLWLHGSGPGVTAMSNWSHLLDRFAPHFYNVAPDVLGFGDSSHPEPPPVGMAAYTELRRESLIGLMDELGISRAHVVGNSMGALIAMEIAAKYPDRVDKMILMGSGGAPLDFTPGLVKLVTFYDSPTTDDMSSLMKAFVHDSTHFAGRLHEIATDRLALAMRPDVRRSHLATFDPSGEPVRLLPEVLATIDHEALLVHGREDRIIEVGASYYYSKHLRNAQLHVFPNAGHWVQIEEPERFSDLAIMFLTEEVSAGSRP